ncbi:MAG: hypothetical protein EOO53_14095 [Gammaproteobacteria bacterium]|nr:MAG: hypothetical protein EOO53_14095 [Gammaproteobacteria bacterium]
MRISLLSDVHAEFYDDNWLPPLPDNPDVLVLAGDMHVGKRLVTFVEKISAALPSTHIIFVAGNHEFYRQYRGRTLESYRRAFFGHKKIHFLENSFVELEGMRFIGATLWTGFPLNTMNFDEREVFAYVEDNVTDFNVIADERSKFKTFTPAMARELFFESKCAIESMIKTSQVGNTVVVTHFPPIPQLIHPGFNVSEVTSYFTSDCL